MEIKYSICDKQKLNEVPATSGQLIYVKDTCELYLDTNIKRLKISDIEIIDNVESVDKPVDNKLYFNKSDMKVYVVKDNKLETIKDKTAEDISFQSELLESTNIQDAILELNTKLSNQINTNKQEVDESLSNINEEISNIKLDIAKDKEDIETKLPNTFANNVEDKLLSRLSITYESENSLNIQSQKLNVSTLEKELDLDINLKSYDVTFTSEDNGDITLKIPEMQKLLNQIKDLDDRESKNHTEVVNQLDSFEQTSEGSVSDLISKVTALESSLTNTDNIANQNKDSITVLNNEVETLNSSIDTMNGDISEITNNYVQLESNVNDYNEANDTNILEIKSDIETIKNNNKTLSEEVNTKLESFTTQISTNNETISEYSNKIDKSIEDIESTKTKVDTNTNNISDLTSKVEANETNINKNTESITTNSELVNTLKETVDTYSDDIVQLKTDIQSARVTADANLQAVQGLRNEIETYHHYFRGYYEHNNLIQAIENPQRGDYAYSGETNTIWSYETDWLDTEDAIPSDMGGKTQTTPLMNGEANVGKEQYYAAGDHVHPTDITRLSVEEFTSYKAQVEQTLLSKLDKTDETLNTTSKTIVGAINELLEMLNELKNQ